MEWTDDQQNEIRDSYWKTGTAMCPNNHGAVNVDIRDSDGMLAVVCQKCGGGYEMKREDDPLAPIFREWTQRERSDLLNQNDNAILRCHVDDSLLHKVSEPIGGSTRVGAKADVVRCGRCGQSAQSKEY